MQRELSAACPLPSILEAEHLSLAAATAVSLGKQKCYHCCQRTNNDWVIDASTTTLHSMQVCCCGLRDTGYSHLEHSFCNRD